MRMSGPDRRRPLLFELGEGEAPADPVTAPPPVEPGEVLPVARLAALGARQPSRLWRLFLAALGGLVGMAVALAAWEFVAGLIGSRPWLGALAAGLGGLALASGLLLALREWLAVARLARLGDLRSAAEAARVAGNERAARSVLVRLDRLYAGRPELAAARGQTAARAVELFDGDALLDLAETELLAPLDTAARAEIEAAARQVAGITALVPLALADVLAALVANLRMIRRIAEIYGGRGGSVGTWRLMRRVLTHLVATGAVAVGDDLIGSVAGGGLVGKLSRRFGEGVVNGALTARVGVAAMDLCRPLPFRALRRPSVSGLVQRALAGLFNRG